MGVVARDLPPPKPPTPFARFGHLTSLALGLLMALAAWLAPGRTGT
jgi:hypothetical protein